MPLFTPIGGGGIGKAAVTATTGSPTIDTTSRPGKTIYKFTTVGAASITIGTAGTAEILVVGGGGAGSGNGGGGGGAGGCLYSTSAYLPAGVLPVFVGDGGEGGRSPDVNRGIGGANGATSLVGEFYSPGGGCGGYRAYNYPNTASPGGSGGGGSYETGAGIGTPGLGNAGAPGVAPYYYGGGGGAGGAATNSAGGIGRAISITGSSVTYAAGGNAYGSGGNGAANTGNGGNGSNSAPLSGYGGSGIVIVVIG